MNALGRKSAFLALLLVMATAVAGSAYTLWFEDLQLNVQATTTSLDGRIRCGTVSDNENPVWPATPPPSNDFPPHSEYPQADPLKNVAVGPTSTGSSPFHTWSIVVSNTYPGWALDCEVEVRNNAPLPWHLETIVIKVEECVVPSGPCTTLTPPPASQVTNCPVAAFTKCTWGDLGINPPDYPDGLDDWSPIYVEAPNWQGCQVHQNGVLEGSMFIGVNQSAKENTKYVITVTYTVNQWNESVWDGCYDPKATPPPA
jgi:hypothetical protein